MSKNKSKYFKLPPPPCGYHKNGDGFPHDLLKEIDGLIPRNHEEFVDEHILSAGILQEAILLASKQHFIRVLRERERCECKWVKRTKSGN